MRWQGRRESNNVEDRRNRPGGPSLGGRAFVFRAEKRHHSVGGGVGRRVLWGGFNRSVDRPAGFAAAVDAFDKPQ